MAALKKVLLPKRKYESQKVMVLYGLGGIGKTQLAVAFARKYHRKFSPVFWFDGRTEDSLKQSIADCASRIPGDYISMTSRWYSGLKTDNAGVVVEKVLEWLSQPTTRSGWLSLIILIEDAMEARLARRHTISPNTFPGQTTDLS